MRPPLGEVGRLIGFAVRSRRSPVPPIPSRRLAVAALLAAAVWVLPVALAGSVGTGGLAGSASSVVDAALGSSCASAAGTIHVGMVIDFGGAALAGTARTPVRQCLSITDRGSGADALAAGGHTLGWSSSGLLCSIDSYPKPGSQECGEQTASGGYRYWSYWHSDGSSWSYSSVGPSDFRPKEGSVEGWHFVDGDESTVKPPALSPTSPCPTAPATTVPPSGGGAPSGGGSSGGGTPTSTPTVTTSGAGDRTDPSVPDGAVGLSGGSGATDASGATATTDGSGTGPDDTASGDVALGANAPTSAPGHGSGIPIGLIVVAVAIVGLGGSALFRWRARTES